METAKTRTEYSKWWSILVGTGLALSPIHNRWLTALTTNDKGETLLFLPALAYLIWIMGTGLFLLNNWDRVKANGWGDKHIVVPLVVIVCAIGLSGIGIEGSLSTKFAPLGAGASLFALYLASRVLGRDIFLPIAVGAIIASLGIVISQALNLGWCTGGLVFEDNFDIATGYILLGVAFFVHKWRWLLVVFAVIALLLTGAPEAAFAIGATGIVLLMRKDWSVKLIAPAIVSVLLLVAGLVSGCAPKLYSYMGNVFNADPVALYISPEGESTRVSPVEIRARVIQDAFEHLKPLGDGYNLTGFKISTVHNVPLIIVQQLGWAGVVAGLAWLWASFFCLVKTRWKYAWALILILSVFDHYIWTQLAPYFWVLVGVSTTSTIRNDLVFRRIP